MFLTILGTLCVIIISYLVFQLLHLQWTNKDWLYYAPRCKPFFGHILSLHDREWYHREKPNWFRDGQGTFVIQMFSQRVIMTTDVTIWEALLSSQKYISKGDGYWVLEKFLGHGLAVSTGDLWRKRRRMITPAFHFEILNEFVSIMESRTLELIEMLNKFHKKDEAFNAFDVTKPFSLSIMCETSMGIDLTIEETATGRFKAMLESLVQIVFRRLLNPLYKSDWLYSQTKNGKKYYSTLAQLRGFVKKSLKNGSKFDKILTKLVK